MVGDGHVLLGGVGAEHVKRIVGEVVIPGCYPGGGTIITTIALFTCQVRDGAETGVFGLRTKLRFFDLDVCGVRVLAGEAAGSASRQFARGRGSEVTRSRLGERAGDAGRGQSTQAAVPLGGLFQLASQQPTLSGKGVQGREGRGDFSIVMFDTWRRSAAAEGLVGLRALLSQLRPEVHDRTGMGSIHHGQEV